MNHKRSAIEQFIEKDLINECKKNLGKSPGLTKKP